MRRGFIKAAIGTFLSRLVDLTEQYPATYRYLEDGSLVMGAHTYGLPRLIKFAGDLQQVRIGKFCSIAPSVSIFTGGNHRIEWVSTYPFRLRFNLLGQLQDGHPTSKGDVVIGSDVWIGYGATIMSGVTIGHGAVIAARAVVTKDVAPYTIVGGNPAKLLKQRFSDDQIEVLMKIAWWDWPLDDILPLVNDLNGGDINTFIAKARQVRPLAHDPQPESSP